MYHASASRNVPIRSECFQVMSYHVTRAFNVLMDRTRAAILGSVSSVSEVNH